VSWFWRNCKTVSDALLDGGRDGRFEAAAVAIGAFFGVKPHEVAFFTVNAGQRSIVFRWPGTLSAAATIPLKAFNSLVAKTANERRSSLDNAFASTRHLEIIEHLLTERTERIPVQKIMSVPIVSRDAVIGVIQVTRKGATREEAGSDFTPADLADLERLASEIAGAPL
jgi:GAF domain-containing protein